MSYTVTRTHSIEQLLENLSPNSPERPIFASEEFKKQFPNGEFNCWGIPIKAKPSFDRTKVGDLVLFSPEIGDTGGITYLGVIKTIYPKEAYNASRILWPDTPDERLFPWLFFFDTEVGSLPWYDFLDEMQISSSWNPRGWYRKISDERFAKWKGTEGYLWHLRNDLKFTFIDDKIELYKSEIELVTEEIEVIVGKRNSSTRQGFSASAEFRKAIESYAMKRAIEFFTGQKWEVIDVSNGNSYDLLCPRGA